MHLAGRLFQTPGQTFSRACRDLSVDMPVGRWNQIEAQPAPDLADAVECYWEGWGEVPLLDDLWGDAIHRLTERLADAPNCFARFDLLEEHLRRLAPGGGATIEDPPS